MATLTAEINNTPLDIVDELSLTNGSKYVVQNISDEVIKIVEKDSATVDDFAFTMLPNEYFTITVESEEISLWTIAPDATARVVVDTV